MAEAAKLIMEAKNPILLVGHAVHTSKSGEAVKELAAQDELPGDPDLGRHLVHQGHRGPHLPVRLLGSLGRRGRGIAISPCALGTELGEPLHYGRWRHWYAKEATRKWIYVQQDPTAIGVNRPIDVPLVGDIRAVVPQLSRALGKGRAPASGLERFMKEGAAELVELAKEIEDKTDGSGNVPMHTSRFIVEATKAFPKDGIMIRDGGATVIFGWTYNQCKPHDVIWNQNYGHIGTGLPYATGAMLADQAATGKSRPGMLVTSDSSFLFHIGELEVAVRKNLPLVCVVAVDFQWGLEVGVYKRTFGQGTAETGTHWSDKVRFDKIAEGFGCYGEFVQTADEIGPAIARAYASGKPAVIHVPIDPKANSEEMPKYERFRTWYAEGTQ